MGTNLTVRRCLSAAFYTVMLLQCNVQLSIFEDRYSCCVEIVWHVTEKVRESLDALFGDHYTLTDRNLD